MQFLGDRTVGYYRCNRYISSNQLARCIGKIKFAEKSSGEQMILFTRQFPIYQQIAKAEEMAKDPSEQICFIQTLYIP